MLDKNKQYVISTDGKKIATGLAKDDVGDIKLWGLEEPSIEERKERKYSSLEHVAKLEENVMELLKNNKTEDIAKAMTILTE